MKELIENSNMVHSYMGLFHVAMSFLAIIVGTMVLIWPKGTNRHKKVGYLYFGAMLLVNTSALFLYNLTGRPSPFHLFAIVALVTLLGGIIPAVRRSKGWYKRHYYFMSWSVVGLYCAFWAETGTRLLEGRHFWWVVML
ncbi:MAG TPA: DUF2306 domain-containing protein, partial [Roseivirga sp.]